MNPDRDNYEIHSSFIETKLDDTGPLVTPHCCIINDDLFLGPKIVFDVTCRRLCNTLDHILGCFSSGAIANHRVQLPDVEMNALMDHRPVLFGGIPNPS